MSFPRTLLLTWQAPDVRYAGGEVLRRILGELPAERVAWAYLQPCRREVALGPVRHAAFAQREAHWRLRRSALRYLYENDWQSGRLAERIARWLGDSGVELIWTLAEMGSLGVALRLQRRLGAPLHATVDDAYEFARSALPRYYYPFCRRAAGRWPRRSTTWNGRRRTVWTFSGK